MKKPLTENDADTLITDDYSADALWNQKLDIAGVFRMRKELEKRRMQSKRVLEFGTPGMLENTKEEAEELLIADYLAPSDLMIFWLNVNDIASKAEWNALPVRIREVLEEIIYSLPLNASAPGNGNDDGCYTFSYCDSEVDLSIISIVVNGKVVFFYKDLKNVSSATSR